MSTLFQRALLAALFVVLAELALVLINLAMSDLPLNDPDPIQYWAGFALFVLAAATPFAALIWVDAAREMSQ